MEGQCFEYSDREYTYKLCPFDYGSQRPKHGGSETRLGSWGSWEGTEENRYARMKYDRGVQCWNGPQRSLKVFLPCVFFRALLLMFFVNRSIFIAVLRTKSRPSPSRIAVNTKCDSPRRPLARNRRSQRVGPTTSSNNFDPPVFHLSTSVHSSSPGNSARFVRCESCFACTCLHFNTFS